ncbi:MAG: type II secretion system protein GspG [Gemmatimonadaceae bacterium]
MLALLVVATALAYFKPLANSFFRDPRVVAQSAINGIGAALETYHHDVGRYPTTLEGLKALYVRQASLRRPESWLGPYLEVAPPPDPWGNPYVYRTVGEGAAGGFILESYGGDGRAGGEGVNADVVLRR